MIASKNVVSHMRLFSYGFMLLVLVMAAWLHMATPILVALFGLFALKALHGVPGVRSKWVVILVFLVAVTGISGGLAYFARETIENLPKIAAKSVPPLIDWARDRNIDLPFTDYAELKEYLGSMATEQARFLGGLLKAASMQVIFFIVGIVVAVSVFLSPRTELDRAEDAVPENLYALFCDAVAARFALLFASFRTVMGAQLAISAINTVLTAVFVLAVGLPHAVITIGVTFLCGLLPVIGNLISNIIIVAIALTVSPMMALGALAFLVAIHKLEYFLNSRIIGSRIRNPIWLMLLSLILGEKLMGVPGMIIAPVLLHYIKVEMSRLKLPKNGAAEPAPKPREPAP